MTPEDTAVVAGPKVRALGASPDTPVMWLGVPTQKPPAVEVATGRKPVDLDKVPAYLRDNPRFRR